MSQLFKDDSSDSDVDINTNKEYAKNYDAWRHKEELHKLHMKYKNESESSSSEEDDDEIVVDKKFEQEFFKTLSYLKKKDPRIYDNNFDCFGSTENSETQKPTKKKKSHTLTLRDYERQLILEKGGQLSDDEGRNDGTHSPTYAEEQNQLKEDLKKALYQVGDDDGNEKGEWGGIFKSRKKTNDETAEEENDYKLWLTGEKQHLDSQNDENELKPLKEFWTNPKLEEDEKFLRDYILSSRFLESEDNDYIPTYEEIVHDSDEGLSEDEKAVSIQEEFEHKYNFRYEDPDQEFIKRYPRTMEHSLRKKDDKRKVKRSERKDRKILEKQNKMEEMTQLKAMKRKEIEEKIKKLQEVTGNDDVGFELKDLDDEFDPAEHDKRMRQLFSSEFYSGPEGDAKPEFPELDEELEIEKWDEWRGNEATEAENCVTENQPHCEDENFNMDCDYDPANHHKELINNSRKKKKQKRKSKFAKIVSEPKPLFNPEDKTYQEYLDQYYKLDCEDVIGDIPCRFKYRTVVPNNFGLSIEEILMAKDKELNRWSSLKKAVQYRPEHVEKYDVIAFKKKAQNENLKQKFLPSLFASEEVEDITPSKSETAENKSKTTNQKFKKGGDVKLKNNDNYLGYGLELNSEEKKNAEEIVNNEVPQDSYDHETTNFANDSASTKRKNNYKGEIENIEKTFSKDKSDIQNDNVVVKTKKCKKRKVERDVESINSFEAKTEKQNMGESNNNNKRKKKKNHNVKSSMDNIGISDARLSAYGINPKKYKNKLKYGNRKM